MGALSIRPETAELVIIRLGSTETTGLGNVETIRFGTTGLGRTGNFLFIKEKKEKFYTYFNKVQL